MAKRNSKGQFVKGSGGAKKGAKKRPKKGAKGGSLEARVARLEGNQALLVGVVDGLETRVTRVESVVSKLAGAMGERFSAKKRKKRAKKSAAAV